MQETTETRTSVESIGLKAVEMTYKRVDHSVFEERACEEGSHVGFIDLPSGYYLEICTCHGAVTDCIQVVEGLVYSFGVCS